MEDLSGRGKNYSEKLKLPEKLELGRNKHSTRFLPLIMPTSINDSMKLMISFNLRPLNLNFTTNLNMIFKKR